MHRPWTENYSRRHCFLGAHSLSIIDIWRSESPGRLRAGQAGGILSLAFSSSENALVELRAARAFSRLLQSIECV